VGKHRTAFHHHQCAHPPFSNLFFLFYLCSSQLIFCTGRCLDDDLYHDIQNKFFPYAFHQKVFLKISSWSHANIIFSCCSRKSLTARLISCGLLSNFFFSIKKSIFCIVSLSNLTVNCSFLIQILTLFLCLIKLL